MFIQSLLNQGNMPLLEQTLHFSAARAKLIAENVSNATTPGYVQKDLSVEKFQKMLRDRVDGRSQMPAGAMRFDDINVEIEHPTANILFHDRNNRSMEQLMSDSAKNAMFHNMMVEMLRKQFDSIESALRERIA